jgi:serine/threonine-protein kinase RIO1
VILRLAPRRSVILELALRMLSVSIRSEMPNDPYLDASVAWRIRSGTLDLHEAGYQSTVEAILSCGLATEIVGLISAGKEADVYLCLYNQAPIAVKVYRLYRTSHKGGGPIKQDSTGWMAAHEYEMTRQAWKAGCLVPAPARRIENMFSMRYLGNERGPAPRLSDVVLDDPAPLLDEVLAGIEGLAQAGVVHADMSAHNILIFNGKPWFIDFSEAIRVDRTGGIPWIRLEQARAGLSRGMNALEKYFKRYGQTIPAEEFVDRVVRSLDRFGVLESGR